MYIILPTVILCTNLAEQMENFLTKTKTLYFLSFIFYFFVSFADHM
jgi:hypothetical protein